jgi:hypothetical protein
MQDFEASDGVVTTNIDTTITATRTGSLRLGSDTGTPAQTSLVNQTTKIASYSWL